MAPLQSRSYATPTLCATALALQASIIYAVVNTPSTFITSYNTGAVRHGTSDPSITAGVATVVEFVTTAGTVSTGDKAEFITSGACTGLSGSGGPQYAVTVCGTQTGCSSLNDNKRGTATVTLTDGSAPSPAVSGFKLCYSAQIHSDTGGDSAQQTTLTDVATVTATTTTEFTGIDPVGIYATVGTSIRFTGVATAGDKAEFNTDCTAATFDTADGQTAALSGTNAMQGPFTMSSTGVYRLCIRNSGGTDSTAQDSIYLSVSAIGGNTNDPVSWYGDKVRVFELTPQTLTPILSATDMTLHGQTFYHEYPSQQWFDRMVLASPGGERWVQIQVRKDILQFNGSRAPKGHFETLQVTLGHGDFENPTMRTELTGPNSAEIPLNFLGFDVAFWKMNRNARAAHTRIGHAHRECMEAAGANIHFYVCSSPAHEFFGWQRDLSIVNAHLDFIMVEVLHAENLQGILPELWGMQPMSEETRALIVHDSANGTALEHKPSSTSSMPALPKGAAPRGEAWAGGFGFKDLEESCKDGKTTVLSCNASSSKDDETTLSV